MVKVAVTGQKVWSDDASKAGDTRPQSITINLLRNGSKVDSAQVTPDDDDAWSFAFEGLDKYDDEGEKYTYTVEEEPVEGYDGEASPRARTSSPSPTPSKTSARTTRTSA